MADPPSGRESPPPARDEEVLEGLVTSAQRGDTLAFGELVRRTYTRVYNQAYRILRNAREAEDLTQDVFLRVWRSLPSFRGESRFTTWLYRVAANAGLNRRRQLRRQAALDDAAGAVQTEAHGPDLEAESQAHERSRRLREAIARLPARYRQVIALFYGHQLPYEQISRTLSIPLGTVKAQLSRARQALKRLLKEDEGTPDP